MSATKINSKPGPAKNGKEELDTPKLLQLCRRHNNAIIGILQQYSSKNKDDVTVNAKKNILGSLFYIKVWLCFFAPPFLDKNKSLKLIQKKKKKGTFADHPKSPRLSRKMPFILWRLVVIWPQTCRGSLRCHCETRGKNLKTRERKEFCTYHHPVSFEV